MTTFIVLLGLLVLGWLAKTALTTPIEFGDPLGELNDLLGMSGTSSSTSGQTYPVSGDGDASDDVEIGITIDHYPVPLSRHLR